MKKILLAGVLALLPLPLAAQSRIAVGVGPGVTQSDLLSGGARHAQASLHLLQLAPGLSLRAEGLYQQGTVSGSPLDCRVAEQQYCTGRSDDNRLMGGGIYSRLDLATGRGVTAYLTPIGVGVYDRRTHTTEWEARRPSCSGLEPVYPCDDDLEWTELRETTSRRSLGWTSGGGVEVAVGRGRVFVEARVHDLLEPSGMAGALPLTLGLSL